MLCDMTVAIGLTGGIGSGKSTVSRLFEKHGARIIDADAIVHELQAPGAPLLDELAREFGPEILQADGALDREALGALVFRDPAARQRLGDLMHPRVIAEMVRRLEVAREEGVALAVLDIPLLFEGAARGTGISQVVDFDATVLVYAPEAVQLERQMERDGRSREEALQRLRSQLSIEEKRELADIVIDNSGSIAETERQVERVYRELTRSGS